MNKNAAAKIPPMPKRIAKRPNETSVEYLERRLRMLGYDTDESRRQNRLVRKS